MNHNTMPDNNALIVIIMITTIRRLQLFFVKSIHTINCYRYCRRVLFGLKLRTTPELPIAPSKARDTDINN